MSSCWIFVEWMTTSELFNLAFWFLCYHVCIYVRIDGRNRTMSFSLKVSLETENWIYLASLPKSLLEVVVVSLLPN